MNLKTKKELAARTFGVGKERVLFVNERLDEIKEAITKQDMKDLLKDGAVKIKEIKGRKSSKRKSSRSQGNVRKRVNKRKKNYIIMTRKLRKHVAHLKGKGELSRDEVKELRKKIRNKAFKSKNHMKEQLGQGNKFSTASGKGKGKAKSKTKKTSKKKNKK